MADAPARAVSASSSSMPSLPPRERLTLGRVVRSEWIRFVSVRSTVATLLAAGGLMAVFGVIAAAASAGAVEAPGGPPPGFGGTDPLGVLMAGQTPVVLIVGVLGVVLGAREHASGMVRTTYAASPRRWPVLLARVVVLVVAAMGVLAVGVAIAFTGGNAVLAAAGEETVALDGSGVPRALVGVVVYLTTAGVFGVLFGTLARGIGPGVGGLIALLLVLPGFGSLLLPDSWQEVIDYLPSQAATAFTTAEANQTALSAATGALVVAVWLAALAGTAVALLLRRDV